MIAKLDSSPCRAHAEKSIQGVGEQLNTQARLQTRISAEVGDLKDTVTGHGIDLRSLKEAVESSGGGPISQADFTKAWYKYWEARRGALAKEVREAEERQLALEAAERAVEQKRDEQRTLLHLITGLKTFVIVGGSLTTACCAIGGAIFQINAWIQDTTGDAKRDLQQPIPINKNLPGGMPTQQPLPPLAATPKTPSQGGPANAPLQRSPTQRAEKSKAPVKGPSCITARNGETEVQLRERLRKQAAADRLKISDLEIAGSVDAYWRSIIQTGLVCVQEKK